LRDEGLGLIGERVVEADFHRGSNSLSSFFGAKERRLYLRVEGKQTVLDDSTKAAVYRNAKR
jgi:hypothetical protein